MPSALETIVLDSAGASPLTLQSGTVYDLLSYDPGVAQARPTWTQSVEQDGALLVTDPPLDNVDMRVTVQIIPTVDTKDAAEAAKDVLAMKLRECSAAGPDGIACTLTKANSSTTNTFYAVKGEFTPDSEALDAKDPDGFMRLNNKPTVSFVLTRKPYFYWPEMGNQSDTFGFNSIGNYTADTGATGNVSITGGVMQGAANVSTGNAFARTAGWDYTDFYDSQGELTVNVGSTLSGFVAGLVFKRQSNGDRLAVVVNDDGSNTTFRITNNVGGVGTVLASTALTRITTNTTYYIQARIEGNTVYGEWWTSLPTTTGSPAATVQWTLTGSDITMFGQGVSGKAGIRFTPASTSASVDDFVVKPNVWKSGLPVVTGTLPGVPGQVPAFVRLLLVERAGQSQRFVEVGLQQRFYQGLALQIDAGSLVTASFAGGLATVTGSYNTQVIEGLAQPTALALCSTGSLGHTGTFRVWAKCKADSTDTRIRLSWADGASQFSPNSWAAPVSTDWGDIDLGTITIQPTLSGTQSWTGRIEVVAPTGADQVTDVDYLLLVPCEVYAKALTATTLETVTVFSARDPYGQSAGSLAGKTAATGGNWAGAGDADDFAVEATGHTAQRTATSDANTYTSGRYAVLPVTLTDTVVSVDFKASAVPASGVLYQAVLARYTDTDNYVRAGLTISASSVSIKVDGEVAAAYFASRATPIEVNYSAGGWYTLRLAIVGARYAAWFGPRGERLTLIDVGQHTALSTLTSGKPGIYDGYDGAGALTRNYDNFFAAAAANDAVLFAGRQAQFRTDGAIRQDSTGTYTGPMPRRGADLVVPPAGAENRTTRIAVRALRNNPDETANPNVTDKLQAQAIVTPRFIVPK